MSVLKRAEALARLRRHQPELTRLGVAHLSVFGSVARDTAEEASDVDVVVDSPDGSPLGLFRLARVAEALERILDRPVDVISRAGLNHASAMRRLIAADIVDAF
jgi:hypothetical protein